MEKKSFKIQPYIYFIISTLLIIILFPREGKFRYSFTEGRPWQYGLLTASFDFPINKSTEDIKKEQDTIISNIDPYFQIDNTISEKQIQKFNEDYANLSYGHWAASHKKYIDNILPEIYSRGIVSNADYEFLKSNQYRLFMVLEKGNTAIPYSLSDVFTIKSAYSYILDKCPPNLDVNVFRAGNLNNYLHENLKYDEAITEKVKNDELQKISISIGMVQAGEKIVDRGEIINGRTYAILLSLKEISEKGAGSAQRQGSLILGISVLVVALMSSLFLFLFYFRKDIYTQTKDVIFLLTTLSTFVFLTEICVSYNLFNIYIIPYAVIPITVRTFFDSRTAHITHIISIFICSLMLPLPFEFILTQFLICMIVIFVLKDLTQRSELIRCAFYIFLTYFVTYLGLLLFREGDLSKIDWLMLLYFGINFLFVMFTYPLIYILEKVFGYISNVTLVELSDTSTPALTSLSETCPGTFQHSLQVSMLGTAAAVKVNANPQLVRTGALYHDLGKMVNPAFFTENKIGNNSPHDQLTPKESARIITNHIPDGIKKAAEFNLPPAIVKFIQTHHGKGKAKYFYYTYKNQNPDKEIDEDAFSYNGMNPDTKETAILMMADSVEAASRSLNDYSEESIRSLVDKIIDSQIADGLMEDAPLTFKDITTIKNVFVDKLTSMYHSRITYPELTKNQAQ